MDFDALVVALTALEGAQVRIQVGTRSHDHLAAEATGILRCEVRDPEWSIFVLDGSALRIQLRRSELTDAAGPTNASGPLRFVNSGVEFCVALA